jgi:anti-sigma factor RsiW
LRAALGGALQQPANPQLDPAQIRQRLKRQSRRHLASAAVLLIAVGLGGFSGWQAREMTLARASVLPMTDALQAYRLIAQQGILPADYKVDSDGDMQHWLDRYFTQASRLPDLKSAGFEPVSGRLLSTDEGPAAMVMYEDRSGHKVSFYVRPPGPKTPSCHAAAAATAICRPITGPAAGTTMRWSARQTRRRRSS